MINDHLKFDNRILCTAIHIFCTFCRKFSFAEFNHFVACGMAHFIAAKIEYKNPNMEFYERFSHDKYQNNIYKGKVVRDVKYEEEKEKIHIEAIRIELDMLTVLGFDFDYHFPFTLIKVYLQKI